MKEMGTLKPNYGQGEPKTVKIMLNFTATIDLHFNKNNSILLGLV